MRVAIIGAGLAGLACAGVLAERGHAGVLFDKGRGPGGRMATRRLPTDAGEAGFDHNAQYFAARDPGFAAQVEAWATQGLAARWPAAGGDAWVGTPTMKAPVRALAAADVRWQEQIKALEHDDGWRLTGSNAGRFDAAAVVLPAEQVAALVGGHDPIMARAAEATPSAPCWTVSRHSRRRCRLLRIA